MTARVPRETGFANQLVLDVLKEEDEIGKEVSFLASVSQTDTQVSNKSVQVKPEKKNIQVKPISILDQSTDDYVVPDLSYWFEDEWDEICERNNLLMPRLNQITQHKSYESKTPTDLKALPLYQAVHVANQLQND